MQQALTAVKRQQAIAKADASWLARGLPAELKPSIRLSDPKKFQAAAKRIRKERQEEHRQRWQDDPAYRDQCRAAAQAAREKEVRRYG